MSQDKLQTTVDSLFKPNVPATYPSFPLTWDMVEKFFRPLDSGYGIAIAEVPLAGMTLVLFDHRKPFPGKQSEKGMKHYFSSGGSALNREDAKGNTVVMNLRGSEPYSVARDRNPKAYESKD